MQVPSSRICTADWHQRHTMQQPQQDQLTAPKLRSALLAGLDRRCPLEQRLLDKPTGDPFYKACRAIDSELEALNLADPDAWAEQVGERRVVQLLRCVQLQNAWCLENLAPNTTCKAALTSMSFRSFGKCFWPFGPRVCSIADASEPSASLYCFCSMLGTLGEEAASLGRDLQRSDILDHRFLEGMAFAGIGACEGLQALQRHCRLGALPSAALAGVLRWPVAALLPVSRAASCAARKICAGDMQGVSPDKRLIESTAEGVCTQLQHYIQHLASLVALLLELWDAAHGSGELLWQPAQLLAAAAEDAMQQEVSQAWLHQFELGSLALPGMMGLLHSCQSSVWVYGICGLQVAGGIRAGDASCGLWHPGR